jgi:hypothetical protein
VAAAAKASGGQGYVASTTTQTGPDLTFPGAMGVKVVFDTTSAGTSSNTLFIEGKDKVSGKFYTLLQGAAVTTISTNLYTVFPKAPVTANVSASDALPETWRWRVQAGNSNAASYSVGFSTTPINP